MASTSASPTRVHKDVHAAAKVAAGLTGRTVAEQALVRTAWDTEMEEHLDALDLAAEHHAEGWPIVTLDEQDRVVLHHPDGRVELR